VSKRVPLEEKMSTAHLRLI